MKTGEKLFFIIFLIVGISVAGAGYYLFIWEGEKSQDPVLTDSENTSDPGLPDGQGQKTPPKIIDEIEGDRGESVEELLLVGEDENLGILVGQILDTDKKPIPEVDVAIYRSRSSNTFIFNKNQKPIHTTKSDEQGRFTLDPLYPGRGYRVVMVHDEYAREIIDNIQVKDDEETKLPTITLTTGLTVFGKIRDEKAKAIQGATVTILNTKYDPAEPMERFSTQRLARTDEEGGYTFRHINDGINDVAFLIRATAEGYETKLVRHRLNFDNQTRLEFNFNLAKAMHMKGQVVDQDLKPLANATINAVQLQVKERPNIIATTNDKGEFTLNGLSKSSYYVTASHESYSPMAIKKIDAGREDLYFILELRSGLAGQVVEAQKNPVKSFWINITRIGNSEHAETTRFARKRFSHKEGRFIFDNLDPGKYTLEIMAKGFAPFTSKPIKVEREIYTSGLVFKLTRGGSVSGTVLDPEGKAIKGVFVNLRMNKYAPSPLETYFGVIDDVRGGMARTNSDGFFKITNIKPDLYQLEFGHRNFPKLRLNDVKVEGDRNTEVAPQWLKVGAILQGRVYNDANAPLASAQITIIKSDRTINITATSDAEGFFKVSDLPPGKYEITPMAKMKKNENPLGKIASLLRNTIKDFELHEGEVKEINLIVRD